MHNKETFRNLVAFIEANARDQAAQGPAYTGGIATMRRYILLQYMHGEKSDDPLSMAGTFDDLREAQTFAGRRMRDVNEVIDTVTWTVVWSLTKSVPRVC